MKIQASKFSAVYGIFGVVAVAVYLLNETTFSKHLNWEHKRREHESLSMRGLAYSCAIKAFNCKMVSHALQSLFSCPPTTSVGGLASSPVYPDVRRPCCHDSFLKGVARNAKVLKIFFKEHARGTLKNIRT